MSVDCSHNSYNDLNRSYSEANDRFKQVVRDGDALERLMNDAVREAQRLCNLRNQLADSVRNMMNQF